MPTLPAPPLSHPTPLLGSFYPGYYVTFVTVMFFQEAAKALVTAVDPPAEGAKDGASASGWSRYGVIVGPKGANIVTRFVLWFLQLAAHLFFITYAGAAFVQIGDVTTSSGRSVSMWERIHAIYGKVYYVGHVVALLAFAASFALKAPKKAKGV